MKCPKCGYLGFEDVTRCRNCGYDFSLTPAPLLELPLQRDRRTPGPLDDLSLVDSAMASRPVPPERASHPGSARTDAELPLFGHAPLDDEPMITRPSPPRAPLAVRRATPEVPRVRAEQPRAQSLDLSPEISPHAQTVPSASRATFSPLAAGLSSPPAEGEMARRSVVARSSPRLVAPADDVKPVGIAPRVAAAFIDILILVAVDAVVVYFTMQICGISAGELGMLPKVPLIAFLVVQNGGYLVAFTAGGQTLGKMVAGIRIVAEEPADTLDIPRAMTRTIVWIMLAIPAGLGFLTLFGRDHRGFHDRCAGTRVVRASV
jgi:uncharacterized RDD family membrane protein YckC